MVNMKIVRHVPEAIYHNLNLLGADIPGLVDSLQKVEVCLVNFSRAWRTLGVLYEVSSLFDDSSVDGHLVVVYVDAYDANFESFTLSRTKDMYATVLRVVFYALVGPGGADLKTDLHDLFDEGEKAILSAKSFAGAWDDLVHYTRLLKYEMDKGD